MVPLGYPGWQSECVVSFIDPATKTLWDHTGDISVLNSLNKLIKSKSLLDLSLDYRDQKCPQRSDSCSFTYIQKGTQFQIRKLTQNHLSLMNPKTLWDINTGTLTLETVPDTYIHKYYTTLWLLENTSITQNLWMSTPNSSSSINQILLFSTK